MQISSHKPVFFPGITTSVWVKFSEKKNISFSGLKSHCNRLENRKKLILPLEKCFKTLKYGGLNNGVKLWVFYEYPGAFLDKGTPDIGFTDEVAVQCDVPDVKIPF